MSTTASLLLTIRPLLALLLLLLPSSTAATCLPGPVFLPLSNYTLLLPNLPDTPTIHSWGALLSFSPSSSTSSSLSAPQHQLIGVPSTVTNSTFLTTSPLCNATALAAQELTYAQCLSRRGGVLPLDGGGGGSVVPSTGPDALTMADPSGLAALNPGWDGIMSGQDSSSSSSSSSFPGAVDATVQLHGQDSVTMVSGLIEGGNNHTASHVGLGTDSALLSSLAAAGRIAARSFGLDAGSQSFALPRPGGLVLGGWDDGARAGPAWPFPFSAYDARNGRRVCPLQVKVTSMVVRFDGGADDDDDVALVEASDPLQACLEPYDNLFRLPGNMARDLRGAFAGATGYAAGPIRYASVAGDGNETEAEARLRRAGIYVPEPGLIYPYLANSTGLFNGSLAVTLDNGFAVEIPAEEWFGPVRGIAADGRPAAASGDYVELAVYQDEAPEDAAVFGKVFLSRVYLYVDYDREEFTLSLAAVADAGGGGGGGAGSILVATGDDGEGGGGCEGGGGWDWVKRGFVAVVVVLGVLLVGVLVWWLLRRRRRDRGRARGSDVLTEARTNRRMTMHWNRLGKRHAAGRDEGAPAALAHVNSRDHVAPERDYDSGHRKSSAAGPQTLEIEHVPETPATATLARRDEHVDPIYRDRVNSTEVPGTSARDPPLAPDGWPNELHAEQGPTELDSPAQDRMNSNASSSPDKFSYR